MMEQPVKDWFIDWFDSPFYHTLYKNRDDNEARIFLSNLIEKLNVPDGSRILDMACGKGRHSIFLNENGFDVTGIDLSFSSIEHANKHTNDHLAFYVHDIRRPVRINFFDYVFNLFTSFGYFRTDIENMAVIKSACSSLADNGTLVIDYLNAAKAVRTIKPLEHKNVDGIDFEIKKNLVDNAIVKDISFACEGKNYRYQEYVKAYELPHFISFFERAGFELADVYGDYNLSSFTQESDRLIMVVKKNKTKC